MMQRAESSFLVSDSIDKFCPNVHCPHRAAVERERYTSMQLTAVNRVLEEGQQYLRLKNGRLEAEVKSKNEQLQQLDTLARRETTRREKLEEQLVEIRRTIHERYSAAYSHAASQEAEVARVQQERKLLVEQVLQLQSALNEMVRLNEALQYALLSNGIDASAAISASLKPPTSTPRLPSNSHSSSSPPSLSSSSSSSSSLPLSAPSPKHTSIFPPLHTELPGELNENSHELEKSHESFNKERKEAVTILPPVREKQRDDFHLDLMTMQNVVSELRSLKAFLNSIGGTESSK
ncbi:hypothetical protein BCY84_10612 [Trypanosoma cruzi cruzi]|nr:hypothetical protein TcBrA4_0113840 [Trypanosoma cruzi]PBJ75909.1 hypothetical protein BCY84_10612 [Trypanosoma cruzi cruzi]